MVVSWGLTAGLTFSEIRKMRPGQVMDLFLYRRKYDDILHGITRE
jgi:hypothetical protein